MTVNTRLIHIFTFMLVITANTLLGQKPLQTSNLDKPNIIFILVDDMGWADPACYGHQFHETPVIDQLARDGLRFTNFYAATPVCSSTRSTIQSGQYSARTGITDFIPGHWRPYEKLVVPKVDGHLSTAIQTPGHLLSDAGYVTGYFGKWHLGTNREHQPDHFGYQITENQLSDAFTRSRVGLEEGPKRIDFFTDAAIWFISENKNQPFFLTLSHRAVHIPAEANQSTKTKYAQKPKPDTGVNHTAYAAMTEDLDTSIGRILDTLEKLNLAEKTVVVFTSDNGGLRKTATAVGDTFTTNDPLRDEKGSLYEGGIRVPMIVRWPNVIPAGFTSDAITTTADLLPTFCDLAGAIGPNQVVDGMSFSKILFRPGIPMPRKSVYFHYPHYHHSRPASAIRSGNLKLIEFLDTGELELYDLESDIGESMNLADSHPRDARKMRQELNRWRESAHARMPIANPDYDPDKAEQWWSRRTGKMVDVEALRRRFELKNKTGK
ncbi:MAG: sulfatase [Pirellulaceae bacterium]